MLELENAKMFFDLQKTLANVSFVRGAVDVCKLLSQMMGYPLSFLQEGVHLRDVLCKIGQTTA